MPRRMPADFFSQSERLQFLEVKKLESQLAAEASSVGGSTEVRVTLCLHAVVMINCWHEMAEAQDNSSGFVIGRVAQVSHAILRQLRVTLGKLEAKTYLEGDCLRSASFDLAQAQVHHELPDKAANC